ncbi:lasso peptide biosynthesis B2 protein [Rhodocaloribacter litoris]|uniref:lasso peptide biosynthesis B2 protein n=1 Tax=Rhodocaloribacter litoris TaxID=2558931 RepID=UPI00141E7B4F|nr:lasso peptide biosynthesis B2 protein [Rhodocaloribacter litoris]QXD16159.1 lasso peptide biosynthesis B2 protein [Rhodocaloribacter litoris]
MNTWRKWRRLAWPDRWLLVKALVLVMTFRVGLALFPYRRVVRFVDRTPAGEAVRYDPARVARLVRAVARRLLGDRPCLPQALAVRYLLHRAGVDTVLHIGVAKGPARELLAHAWVEYRGRVLIGGESSIHRYVPLRPLTPGRKSAA